MIPRVAACVLAVLASPAFAEEVTSARIDGVSATLYQTLRGYPDVALVSETRSVKLPAGDTVIHFEGVAASLIPQTVQVEGLPGAPQGTDFDFATFAAATVLDRSVGLPAELIQSPPKSAEIRRSGTLVSQQGIVAFASDAGVEAFGCGGPPSRLVVGVPPGLRAKPDLSVRVWVERAGVYPLRISYLADRVRWRAVYVAKVAEDGRRIDLEGRVVVENASATQFDSTPSRFVFGNLARLHETKAPMFGTFRGMRDCWGLARTHQPVFEEPAPEVQAMAGMALAKASARADLMHEIEAETLGDLKLFRLNAPIRIAPSQKKTFTFMASRAVKAEPFFLVPFVIRRAADGEGARQGWRVANTRAAGLGEPLPEGAVALYRGKSTYLGDDEIPNGVAEGGRLELVGSPTGEVLFDHRLIAEKTSVRMHDLVDRTRSLVLTNTANHPVLVEYRLPQDRVRSVWSGLDGVVGENRTWVWRGRLAAHERRELLPVTEEYR